MHIEKIKQDHEAISGVRLGDYVRIAGNLERISVCSSRSPTIQTTLEDSGAWFLAREGYSDFSGGSINMSHPVEFDRIIRSELRETGTTPGEFWTFKDGQAGAGRRENFIVPCRIFEIKG
jgi:hypothetical protein